MAKAMASSTSWISLLKVYGVVVIFLLITSTCSACNCKGNSPPHHSSSKPSPPTSSHHHTPPSGGHPTPIFPTPTPPITHPPRSPSPSPSTPTPTPTKPPHSSPIILPPMLPPPSTVPTVPSIPIPSTSPPPPPTCPVNIIKLGVCVPLLGGVLGDPLQTDCCALLGIIGLDVEVCLCLAIDANVLGIITVHAKLDVIATILTTCGYKVPPNLTCP